MIRLRALMMVAGLFAMATAAHGQSLSPALIQALRAAAAPNEPFYLRYPPSYIPPSPPYPLPSELARLEAEAEQLANQPLLPPWLTQVVEQGMTTWQKLRAANGDTTVTSKKPCCDDIRPGAVKGADQGKPIIQQIVELENTPTNSVVRGFPDGSFTAETIGIHFSSVRVPPLCVGIKDFMQFVCPIQFKAAQSTPPCCRARACACCETCKPKTTATVQVYAQPLPIHAAPMVWSSPAQFQAVTRVATALPRFETPDLEVHCEKIAHRGDTVIFEGNVMLLSKKHAQPIRVNAQRVILNVKDGSYTVESARPLPPTVSTFGVFRTSAISDGCVAPACPGSVPAARPDHEQRGYAVPVGPSVPSGLVHPYGIQVVPVPPLNMPQTWQLMPK